MEAKEKQDIKYRLGAAILKIIDDNKAKYNVEKAESKISKNYVRSLRKLAAASATEFAIIQKITSGSKNPEFSTIVAISQGLELSLAEFGDAYDRITHEDISRYIKKLNSQKK